MSNENDAHSLENNEGEDDLVELANKMKLRPSLTGQNSNMNKEFQHSEIYTKPVLTNKVNQENQRKQSKVDDEDDEQDEIGTEIGSEDENEEEEEEQEEDEEEGDDNNSICSGISNETEKMDLLMI